MRLQDQRNTFHGSSVCAFTALGEALLQQSLGIREQTDALARGAFTAKVVRKALAIRGLSKHARQGELADSSRTGKEQGVRNASRAQGAAEGRYYAFIAEKFCKAHAVSYLFPIETLPLCRAPVKRRSAPRSRSLSPRAWRQPLRRSTQW